MQPLPNQTPYDFWDTLYKQASPETKGRPSLCLERFAAGRTPGRALDLGCAKGDDAVWLAQQGWAVTAVDISPAALDLARANVDRNGVQDRVSFEAHDLTQSFPGGEFDLISAMFLQTPFSFPRHEVLSRAAAGLASGGLLLAVTHGSAAPWSWSEPDHMFPTAEEERQHLGLRGAGWRDHFVGGITRMATGPSGETAEVIDNVIAIERTG